MHVVIDRIEGGVAVVIADDGKSFDVPRKQLPARAREGSVLRTDPGPDGRPDWKTATLDEEERQRRLREDEKTMNDLRRGDRGGDIAI